MVLPDTAERTFGRFGRMVQRVVSTRGLELVELEDPDFERAFVTTSSDQVEARYILSPSMMKRILEFRQRTGSGFRLSFADSMLHAAIPLSRDLFEMAASRSLVDDAPIREMVRDLEWLSGIVEEMNLNTRIWTKR